MVWTGLAGLSLAEGPQAATFPFLSTRSRTLACAAVPNPSSSLRCSSDTVPGWLWRSQVSNERSRPDVSQEDPPAPFHVPRLTRSALCGVQDLLPLLGRSCQGAPRASKQLGLQVFPGNPRVLYCVLFICVLSCSLRTSCVVWSARGKGVKSSRQTLCS